MTPDGYYTLGELKQFIAEAEQEHGAQDTDICVIDVYECLRIIPPKGGDITIDISDTADPNPVIKHRSSTL